MTSATRREEYSSNIIRTLHPTTTTSTSKDLNENIDYLLDDLQHSVTGTSQYLQSKNVQHLSPANTTSYIKERSISPGRTSYQSSYQYSTSTGGAGGVGGTSDLQSCQSVNQLDALLQDLKKERELSAREKDYALSTHTSTLESSRLSPNLSGRKSPYLSGATSPNITEARWQTSTPTERTHHYEKKIESSSKTSRRDVSFGDTSKPEIRKTPTLSRTEKYVEDKTVPYYTATVTTRENLADDLKNIPLSDDILPTPGTKVTTTVRTYTYEIPPEPITTETMSRKMLYKREVNTNQMQPCPLDRELPPSVTYTTESYRTTTNDADVPPAIKTTKTILQKRDVSESKSSNVYTDRNIISEQTPLIDTSRDVVDISRGPSTIPPSTGGPGGPVTYYYKHHESTNTTNTLYGPPGQPPQQPQQPPRSPYPPAEPGSKTISYSSYSSTKRTTSDREPLLQPAPFPTDGTEPVTQIDSPPKRVDDLMASLGNETVSSRHTDVEVTRKREVETGVATAERPPASKNVAGPPVYYPPGREMFMKKEESGAAYRAGGQYGRAAAKYEYEAEAKSKSKSKSGATMVPVCLPLCCAMPCSIM